MKALLYKDNFNKPIDEFEIPKSYSISFATNASEEADFKKPHIGLIQIFDNEIKIALDHVPENYTAHFSQNVLPIKSDIIWIEYLPIQKVKVFKLKSEE